MFKIYGLRRDRATEKLEGVNFMVTKPDPSRSDVCDIVKRLGIYHGWVSMLDTTTSATAVPSNPETVVAIIDDKGNVVSI